MYKYLICKTHQIFNDEGNVLGCRVCDVCEQEFPVSNDYEWVDYHEYVDIYTGAWYWSDNKPNEYIVPVPPKPVVPETEQPKISNLNTI